MARALCSAGLSPYCNQAQNDQVETLVKLLVCQSKIKDPSQSSESRRSIKVGEIDVIEFRTVIASGRRGFVKSLMQLSPG